MNTPENDKTPYDLIARYLAGEASDDEIIDVEKWKGASSENIRIFDQCRKIWEKSGQANLFTDIDINEEWDHFLRGVETLILEDDDKTGKVFFTAYRIAAIFVIGLILSLSTVFLSKSLRQVAFYTENSGDQIELPDGSIVYLNKNSKISYSKSFKKSRELTLDGEAFFEVESDSSNAFIISAGKVRVEVMGTSFNVDAYKNEDLVKVIVATGKVAVYDKSNSNEKSELEKGEKVVFSRELRSAKISKNYDVNYISWKTGILSFENASLEEVFNKLSEIYNIDFELKNQDLYRCRISVRFDHSDLDYILNTLSLTLGIQIEKGHTAYIVTGEGC